MYHHGLYLLFSEIKLKYIFKNVFKNKKLRHQLMMQLFAFLPQYENQFITDENLILL